MDMEDIPDDLEGFTKMNAYELIVNDNHLKDITGNA